MPDGRDSGCEDYHIVARDIRRRQTGVRVSDKRSRNEGKIMKYSADISIS
jgi:hypothetical protein